MSRPHLHAQIVIGCTPRALERALALMALMGITVIELETSIEDGDPPEDDDDDGGDDRARDGTPPPDGARLAAFRPLFPGDG